MRKILSKDNIENYRSPFVLRNLVLYETEKTYQVGHGKYAGIWFYDPADTTTADNFGLVLVNITNQRLKRVVTGFVSNVWFNGANEYFSSTTDANTKIIASFRKLGLTVKIIDSGSVVEYWYEAGVSDGDLVAKSGGGGSSVPDDLDIVVTASGGTINDGDTSFHIGNDSSPDYRGQRVRLKRNYAPQGRRNTEESYYAWNSATAIFTIFPAAATGESFQIEFY